MATKITTGTPKWPIQPIFFIVTQIASRISPNGANSPICQRPKGLYFNEIGLKEIVIEAQDPRKRASVWKTVDPFKTLVTLEQDPIRTGTLHHPPSVSGDVISEFVKIATPSPDTYDERASFITTFSYVLRSAKPEHS
ncbi:hypothetical protein F5Y13DRAFT_192436 [Hypoxylon sp. FL1857]|nr:hypothetical protein F5Y13DRAFT_192436 [Hypoxylon sp. FL1857]